MAERTLDGWFIPVNQVDRQLVERCLLRDEAAERELYDRHLERVYRLAYRLCGDPDRAADFTQETFIRAFDRLAQFRGDASFGTWLRTITVSIVLNARRRHTPLDLPREELVETIETPAIAAAPPDLRARLHAAIDGLPTKLRAVFVMHDIEGYTHEEIGATLGIPSGTSKGRLSDARGRLRRALAVFAGDLIA